MSNPLTSVWFMSSIVLTILSIIISFRFIQKAFRQFAPIFCFFKYIYIASLLGYYIQVIFRLILTIANFYGLFDLLVKSIIIGWYGNEAVLYLMLLNMYGRIQLSFIGTLYYPSKVVTVSYLILTHVVLIVGIIACVFVDIAFRYSYRNPKRQLYWDNARTLYLANYGLYTVFSGMMLYSFLSRLYMLNKELIKNRDKYVAKEEYTKLIRVVVKYIVLCSLQLFSTLFWFTTSLIVAKFESNELSHTFHNFAAYFDVIINMCALYLQYKFGENDYYKMCKFCDQFVYYCIKPKTEIKTDIQETTEI